MPEPIFIDTRHAARFKHGTDGRRCRLKAAPGAAHCVRQKRRQGFAVESSSSMQEPIRYCDWCKSRLEWDEHDG